MNIQSQDFGVNTVCGSSRVLGLRFFLKTGNCDIPLDIVHVDSRLSPTCPRLHLVGLARSWTP